MVSGKSPDKVRELTQLMTVPEILAALGGSVSRDTFYKWRQTGKGPRCFSLPNGELAVQTYPTSWTGWTALRGPRHEYYL